MRSCWLVLLLTEVRVSVSTTVAATTAVVMTEAVVAVRQMALAVGATEEKLCAAAKTVPTRAAATSSAVQPAHRDQYGCVRAHAGYKEPMGGLLCVD
jgi:hypothetical protein